MDNAEVAKFTANYNQFLQMSQSTLLKLKPEWKTCKKCCLLLCVYWEYSLINRSKAFCGL